MQQLEFFEIPSPCIGVCQSGPKGYCLGCYRSRDERLYWIQLEADVKRKIIKACQRRKKRALAGKSIIDDVVDLPVQVNMFDDSQN